MRRFLVGAVTTAIMAIPAASGHAGGSWLETERRAYAVGELAVARGAFGSGQLEGRVSDGPYEAYLVPGFRWFETPGPVPDYAIPIGRITITEGTVSRWVGHLDFEVPDVPAGRYSIQYCNAPCTVDGIGDLMGGSFFIGQTTDEARLLISKARLAVRVERLRDQLRRTRAGARRVEELRRELRATEGLRDDLLAANRRLQGRIADLESALAAERMAGPAPARVPVSWAAPLVALSGAVVAVSALRRRRRRGLVPTTVPPELVRELLEDAQVPSRQPTTSEGSPGMVIASPGSSSSGSSPVTKS